MEESMETKSTTGLISRVLNDSVYRLRLLNTIFVVWMFISLGWNTAVVDSVFPDLRLIIHKDLDTASWVFTGGAVGYSIGALVFGFLFDRFNRLLVMVAVVVLCSITFAIIPWCENFALLVGAFSVNSIFAGAIDVGGNAHVAAIWGRNTAPYMQAIHFGFSFGGIISPFTAETFVAEKQCAENTKPQNTTTVIVPTGYGTSHDVTTMAATETTECEEVYGQTHIQYAYLIGAIVYFTAAIPFLLTWIFLRKEQSEIDVKDGDYQEDTEKSHDSSRDFSINDEAFQVKDNNLKDHMENDTDTIPEMSINLKILFVLLLALLISTYASTEGRFSALLSSFVVDYQDWTKSDSLHVSSLFWGSFAAGRFISIGVSKLLKPSTMIITYVLSLTLSFMGLIFASHYEVKSLIWVFTATTGLCMSSIYPCIFTWTAESILKVSGKIAAVFTIGASVFNSVMPILYGNLMDNVDPMYFTYLLLSQCVLCCVIYVIIRILLRIYVTDHKPPYSI